MPVAMWAPAPTRRRESPKRRDVNHDLIAAGHPRLNFEFAAFSTNLPPHWNTKRTKPADPAQAWKVGQAMSAHAAADLLAYRACPKAGSAPWPEFAEYDCFACHRELATTLRPTSTAEVHNQPGTIPLSRWYSTMPNVMAKIPELDELERTMPPCHCPIEKR